MGILSSIQKWFEDPPSPSPLEVYRQHMRSGRDGVLLGMDSSGNVIGKQLGMDGHILIVGGAGSGKSSCIAIPTLQYGWKDPALVVDIKGELYAKSPRRTLPASVFNPMDRSTRGYDPFHPLYHSSHLASDIEDIARMLVPIPPDTKADPFWTLSAQNILAAHLLYSFKHGATFLQALYTLISTEPDITLDIEEEEDPECRLFLTHVSRAEKTLSSVMQTLSNHIRPFVTDEHIKDTLSRREIITPHLLEQGCDVFLQLPEYKLEQWKPLINLIVQQFCRHFEQRPEGSNIHTLFMLDEFPRLGKMSQVVHGLATLRSKKVTLMLIIQSLAQLDAICGHDERKIICDNCDFKAVLRATDAETQEYFSKLVGTEERQKITYTCGEETWSNSYSTEEKRIIRPEEFGNLYDIVFFNPRSTFRLQKIPYWDIG